MAKKGTLFNLIKSLSKSEKRYFRLYTGIGTGDKNYLELFDFMDSQEELDEEMVKKKFGGRSFGKQLHVTKNYLSKQILKTLRNFHASGSRRSELSELLMDIEICYKKELYDQCEDLIKRALYIAEKYERFNELLEVNGWKRRVLIAKKGSYVASNEIIDIVEREQQILEILTNINDYTRLTYELFGSDIGNATYLKGFKTRPLVVSPDQAKSFAALTLYYHIQYVINVFGGNPDEGLSAIRQLIIEFENRKHLIEESPEGYVTALNNLMGAMLHLRRQEEAIEVLNKIRKIPKVFKLKQDNYTLKIFLKTYNVELELYRDLKQWEKGEKLIEEVNSFIEHNMSYISDSYLISFYYQFSYILFRQNNYSKALFFLNKIINERIGPERVDIQAYARFLLLMVHYELKNIIVMRYAVDATRRFLKKQSKKLTTIEMRLLRFFSRLSTTAFGDHKELFSHFHQELYHDVESSQKSNIEDYLSFNDWIQSKL